MSVSLRRVVVGTLSIALACFIVFLSTWPGQRWTGLQSFLRLVTEDKPRFGAITAEGNVRYGRGLNLVDIDGDGNLDLWLSTAMPPAEVTTFTSSELGP